MRSYLLASLFFFFVIIATGQNNQRITHDVYYSTIALDGYKSSGMVAVNTDGAPFISYYIEWEKGKVPAEIRFSAEGGEWTEWQQVERDFHNTDKRISQLYFTAPELIHYQLRFFDYGKVPGQVKLHFFNPGESVPDTDRRIIENEENRDLLTCPCELPDFQNRLQWCPDGTCTEHPSPAFTSVTHLVIHHSASSNTSSDWAAVVRSFWDFHVNGNGWSDIGYNWLIDPTGKIYQGREDNVIGAHFCGNNSNTMGICVIGNFTNANPTDDALQALETLLAWKSCDSDVDPLATSFHSSSGMTLNNIIGHRDGCNTACPGDMFYPVLSDVRQGVVDYIATSCTGLAAPLYLSASQIAAYDFQLQWDHTSLEEEGFLLEQSLNGVDFNLIATLPENTITYDAFGLTADQNYSFRVRAFNSTDTSAYSNVVEVSTYPVATQTIVLPTSSVRISPNPAINQITVSTNLPDGLYDLQITDVQQRLIYHQKITAAVRQSEHSIDINQLPSGIYFLKLSNAEAAGVWKFVKE